MQGPIHSREYTIGVLDPFDNVLTTATARNKKVAEQEASRLALELFEPSSNKEHNSNIVANTVITPEPIKKVEMQMNTAVPSSKVMASDEGFSNFKLTGITKRHAYHRPKVSMDDM